jgi:hypothetical protein
MWLARSPGSSAPASRWSFHSDTYAFARRARDLTGFNNLQGNVSPAESDRMIYMDNAGKLVYSVYDLGDVQITSTSAYNDGNWHMVVAEVGTSGMQLWVDGTEVANNALALAAQSYTGYWHLGWSSELSWPDSSTTSYLHGYLSEAAVIPSQLTGGTSSTPIYKLYHETSTSTYSASSSPSTPPTPSPRPTPTRYRGSSLTG